MAQQHTGPRSFQNPCMVTLTVEEVHQGHYLRQQRRAKPNLMITKTQKLPLTAISYLLLTIFTVQIALYEHSK